MIEHNAQLDKLNEKRGQVCRSQAKVAVVQERENTDAEVPILGAVSCEDGDSWMVTI